MKNIFLVATFLITGTTFSQNSVKSSQNFNDIRLFVKSFYSSLELSKELNQKHYDQGGVVFDLKKFNNCISPNAIYSKKKVSNLTGDYHDRYFIGLESIDTIYKKNDSYYLTTKVSYGMYEFCDFTNKEQIVIEKINNKYKVKKWNDIRVLEIKNVFPEYTDQSITVDQGMIYKSLGSLLSH